MTAKSLYRAFAQLSTPLAADAAFRLKISFGIGPPGIRPITPSQRLPGSAMQGARPVDVLVIDNGGRLDEGCIGDLIAIEE
jgi:4-hydroxy-4-methyl-2-oxoglutarate aldolase